MKLILAIFLLNFSLNVFSLEMKVYPEFTADLKGFDSNTALGIKADPNGEMSSAKNEAMVFLKELSKSVIQFRKNCGAVLTSNDGYAVTALHCLGQLPSRLKSPLTKELVLTTIDGEKLSANVSLDEMINHSYESWPFERDIFPDYNELRPLKLIAMGKGHLDPLKITNHDSDQTIRDAGILREYADDYAIIKLNKMPLNHKCVQTADVMPAAGSTTWTAGYPASMPHNQIYLTLKTFDDLLFKTDIFAPELSKYLRQALSRLKDLKGEVWYPFETNQLLNPFYVAVGRIFKNYDELFKKFVYPSNNESAKTLDLVMDPGKYIVSTSFTKPGFSGGGIFNTNQELVGINATKPNPPSFTAYELKPLISHVRIDYIKKQVKEKLGIEKLNEVFNCK